MSPRKYLYTDDTRADPTRKDFEIADKWIALEKLVMDLFEGGLSRAVVIRTVKAIRRNYIMKHKKDPFIISKHSLESLAGLF